MENMMWCVNEVRDEATAAPAAWGARAIWKSGYVDVMRDRMGGRGETAARDRLIELINTRAPKFTEIDNILVNAKPGVYNDSDFVTVLYEDDELFYCCNPQASHGYLYLTAYLKEAA